MFQFPEFASTPLCIQGEMTPKGRVSPFRDLRIIAFCQLPVAFRRLTRLSSPVIAKASTTCTYSLDPITLSPQPSSQGVISVSHLHPYFHRTDLRIRLSQRFVAVLRRLISNQLDTIKTHLAFPLPLKRFPVLVSARITFFTSSKFLKIKLMPSRRNS